MLTDKQSRKWQLTINNPLEKGVTHEIIQKKLETIKSMVYYCLADESGQTHHTHIYLVCSSAVRFSTLKTRFPAAHLEIARGTSEENRAYIAKSGKWQNDKKHSTAIPGSFAEWGEIPPERQGARNDLADLYDMVKEGMSNFDIIEANPDYLLRLTDIERVRQMLRAQQYKNEFRKLNVTYLWGWTGAGKTRSVMEKHGYGNVYRVTDYTHPFDTYAGQEVLLLDEFRGQFPIHEMLNLLDGYPLELPCRYANRIACFTVVYVVSNVNLYEQYQNTQREQPATWQALLRRIHYVTKFFSDGRQKEYTTEEYLQAFVELDERETKGLPFSDQ